MTGELPTTDAEVGAFLLDGYSPLLAKNLFAIYQCHRELGKTVTQAWIEITLACLKTFDPEAEKRARQDFAPLLEDR